jgi:hypothetical protein
MKISNLTLKITLLTSIFSFILRGPMSAQVNVNVVVNPPFTQFAEAYFSPQKSNITLTNLPGGRERDVKIKFKLVNTLNQGLQSKANFTPARPIRLGVGEVRLMSAADFEGIFRRSNFDVLGLSQAEQDQLIRDRLIPEGFYQLCIQILDYSTNAVLSDEVCYDFNVEGVDPPQVINFTASGETYNCGDVVTPATPMMWQCMWTPPVVVGAATNIRYTFEMYQIPQGLDPQQFIAAGNARPFFTRDNLFAPFLFLGQGDVPFNVATQYAFRIQAVDPLGETGFRNGGWSPVCAFTYGRAPANLNGVTITGNPHYPNGINLWMPFEKLPFTVQVASSVPFSTFKYFETQLKLSKADENCTNPEFQGMPISKSWASGGLAGRREELNNPTLSDNMARYLPVNQPFQNLELLRGSSYYWCADIGVGAEVGRATNKSSDARGRFKFGIGVSQPSLPTNNASVAKGSIKLKWKTANMPIEGLFPINYQVVQQQGQTATFANDNNFSNGKVHEKWVLDVSEKANFADFYVQKSGEINSAGYGSASKDDIIAALYKNLEETITIDKNSKFYWRLRWLINPNSTDLNSPSYAQSPVFSFTTGDGGGAGGGQPADPTVEPTVVCSDGCKGKIEDVLAVNLDPSVFKLNTDINEKIKIGQFELMVTKITGITGNKMSGQGRITIASLFGQPAFPLLVDFTNIQINSSRVVVSGSARGQNRPQEELLPYVKTGGMLDGLPMFTTGDNVGDFFSAFGDQIFSNAASNVRQSGFKLPIGHRLGNTSNVLLAINRFRFFPKTAFFGAVVEVNLPDANPKVIALGVEDVCIGSGGVCSSFRVTLAKDLEVTIGNDKLVFEAYAAGSPATGTSEVIQQGDFDELQVEGYYQFSPSVFVNATDKVSPVKAKLSFKTKKFTDFIASVQVESFRLKGNDEWVFTQTKPAFWDHDTKNNPQDLPTIARKPELQTDPTWFGFILPEMELQTPRIIKDATTNTYPKVKIANLIVDAGGLTCEAEAKNILPLSNGAISGWGCSIDKFTFKMYNSKFESAGMTGGMVLPISNLAKSGANAQLEYFCNLTNFDASLAFEFQVKPKDKLAFDIFVGEGSIKESSRIKIKAGVGQEFEAEAVLNGIIDIKHDFGGVVGNIDFAQVKFEGFGISKNNVTTGTWSLSSPQKTIAGFPLSLTGVKPYSEYAGGGFDLGIRFNLNFALSEDAAKQPLKATTNLTLFGEIRADNNGRLQPKLDGIGVKLNSIEVSADLKAVKIQGRIDLYRNHATFGDGFKGAISAEFPSVGAGAAATFQVGKVRGFNYWFVDATVLFGAGIPFIAPLQLTGLGGGAYYHMRQTGVENLTLKDNRDTSDAGSSFKKVGGASPSGTVYVPDASVPLGVRLKIMTALASTGEASLMAASLQLQLEFNESYGIRRFAMDGEAEFIKASKEANGLMKGTINILYKADEKIFDLHAEVNSQIGVKGVFEISAKVPVHMYVDASEKVAKYFIKLGTPDGTKDEQEVSGGLKSGPIVVSTKILDQEISGFRLYFQMGNFALDAIPPIEPWILDVFKKSGMDVSDFTSQMVNSGNGIRFGAKWSMDFNQKVLIFRGQMGFVVALDLAFQHYDTDCDGNKTGNPIGLNGWYAQGQIYAGIRAKLSIELDMFLIKGDFVIFDAAAAAILRGGLPNPTWFKGAIGGRYNILDGLVQGGFHFQFSAGRPCTPSADPLESIKLIASTYPNDEDAKNKIIADFVPSVTFNTQIDKEYTFTIVENGVDKVRKFRSRADLVEAAFTDLSDNNTPMPLLSKVSEDQTAMFFYPQSGTDATHLYKFEVKARLEELIGGSYDKASKTFIGGEWKIAKKNNVEFLETREVNNIRLKALDKMTESTIKYTYPFYYQRFYLPDECTQISEGLVNKSEKMSLSNSLGRIELNSVVGLKMFNNKPGEFASAQFRVVPVLPLGNKQEPTITDISLNGTDFRNRISFNMPSNLQPEGIYLAELILMPPKKTSFYTDRATFILDRISINKKEGYGASQDTTSVEYQKAAVAERLRIGAGEKKIASIFFKVSNHQNFEEKMNPIELQSIDFQVEARFNESFFTYSFGTLKYSSRPVRKEATVPLSKADVERSQTEGLNKVLSDKIIEKSLLNGFYGGELYVMGMKNISFSGGECFDDYDILGYKKSSSGQGNSYTADIPPLVSLNNKSVATWVDKVLGSLSSTYDLSFKRTGSMTMPNDLTTMFTVNSTLSGIYARLLSKLTPTEAIGASLAQPCSRGRMTSANVSLGIPMADTDNINDYILDDTRVGMSGQPTIRLSYNLVRTKGLYQANFVASGMLLSGGSLFGTASLQTVGTLYGGVIQAANLATMSTGSINFDLKTPGGCSIASRKIIVGN